MLPRKIESLTLIGLGKSVYDWVSHVHGNFENLDTEIWTINAGAAIFRHDIVWDMHTPEWVTRKAIVPALKRREWLKSHDKPIMMPKALPEYPTSITYPLKDVVDATSSCYFATGISYMLAMALCCEVKRLFLFGCDFSYDRNSNTHDEQGRACAEYWVGRLVASGCHVATSKNSHFMDSFRRSEGRIYGYHEPVTFEQVEGKRKFVAPDYT